MAALVLASKQSGSGTVSTGTTIDITISAIDLAKSYIRLSARGGTTTPTTSSYRYYPTSTTNIRVEFNATLTANFDYEWQVGEFSSGLTSQFFTQSDVDNNETTTITAVTLATSFIVSMGKMKGGATYGADDFTRHSFASTTSVVHNTNTDATDANIAFAVYSIDNCAVQEVTTTRPTETGTSFTVTISTVDTAKTMLFTTCQVDTTGSGFNAYWWSVRLTDSTTLTYARTTGTSGTFVFTTYVVDIDECAVQRVDHSQAADVVNDTATISSVDVDLSFVEATGTNMGWMHPEVNASGGSNQDWNRCSCAYSVDSATTTRVRRDSGSTTSNTSRITVVTFEEGGDVEMTPTLAGTSSVALDLELDITPDIAGVGSVALDLELDLEPTLAGAGAVVLDLELDLTPEIAGASSVTIDFELDSEEELTPTLEGAGAVALDLELDWSPEIAGGSAVAIDFEIEAPESAPPVNWDSPRSVGIVTVDKCAPHVRRWNPEIDLTYTGAFLTRITHTAPDGTIAHIDLTWSGGFLVEISRWVEA